LGDRITLGPGGPVLIVAGLGTAPEMPVARRMGLIARALAWAMADSPRNVGWLLVILLALILLLAGALSGLYRLVSAQVEQTERARRTRKVVTAQRWAAPPRRARKRSSALRSAISSSTTRTVRSPPGAAARGGTVGSGRDSSRGSRGSVTATRASCPGSDSTQMRPPCSRAIP